MRTLPLITLIAAGLLLGGCAAAKHIDRAEAAAIADRHGDAVRHYQQALRARPSLAQDPEFDAAFRRAQAESHAAQAADFAGREHWEQAVSHLEEATRVDPTFELPDRALIHAKREASKQLYDRAIKQADDNRLSDAIDTLRRALDYDGDNLAAKEALPRLIEKRAERQRQAASLFTATQSLIDGKRWSATIAQLDRVLELDPEHHDARRAKQNAKQQIRDSREHQQRGEQLLTAKQLDQAIGALEQALAVWPDNSEATDVLRAARERRRKADETLATATKAWRDRDYDRALTLALDAESIYPFHKPIQQRLGEIRRDGAAQANERGDTLIDLGDLAEAETAFRQAMDFQPRDRDAMRGLGRVDFTRGERAERDGRLGEAYLHYKAAYNHHRDSRYEQRIAAMRGAILDQHRIALNVEAFDGNGNADRSLAERVAALVNHRAPEFMELASSPHYNAQLVVDHITINDKVDSVQHRRHAYTEYRQVRNPRIDELEHAIRRASHELRRLEHRRHQRCGHCHGRGKIECEVDGHIEWESCGHCGGRGHIVIIDERRIRRLRHRISDLERDLRHEPTTIREAYTAYWNYTVSNYVKKGVLEARLLLRDHEGRTVAEQPIEERFAAEDSAIANANPSIGLHGDSLNLPPDDQVRGTLLDTVASDSASSILKMARRVRYEELMAESRTGDPLEPQVAAILVLDPDDAETRLEALMP